MGNDLVFHIGMPKTGSTALERFLYVNADKLGNYGWDYPNLKEELPEIRQHRLEKERNGDLFYNYVPNTDGNTQIFAKNWEKLWNQVLKHLETKNVIISSEGLYEYAEDFWQDVKKKYHQVKVIIYLRRQDRFVESYWNEWVKDINCMEKPFHDYINSDNGIKQLELHYINKLDQISKVVGQDNLMVRVYEKEQFYGEFHTLESDFFSAIGMKPVWKEFVPCGMENPRLKGNYIEIKRLCNSVLKVNGRMETKEKMHVIFTKLSEDFDEGKQEIGYFTFMERKAFLQQFLQENEDIARKYLHREDGVLFYDTRMDYPLFDVQGCTSFERDLIRTFSSIMCDHENELYMLKKQNSFLVKKVLMNYAEGRKIALFGAGYWCRRLLEDVKDLSKIIIDNDKGKSGKNIEGIKVVYTKDINNWSEYFIIITCLATDEIERQLQKSGMLKEKDYVLAKEYFVFD